MRDDADDDDDDGDDDDDDDDDDDGDDDDDYDDDDGDDDALIYSSGNQQFDPVTPQGRNIHLSSISKYRNSVIYKNPARDRMHIENVNAVAVRLHH